jgi:hypothetical protein
VKAEASALEHHTAHTLAEGATAAVHADAQGLAQGPGRHLWHSLSIDDKHGGHGSVHLC